MSLQELMLQLSQHLQLTQVPQADENGCYQLYFDKTLPTNWQQVGTELIISSTLQQLATANQQQLEQTLTSALQYSLAVSKQQAEIVSFDRTQQTLLLYRSFDLNNLAFATLTQALTVFLNNLARWQAALDKTPASVSPMQMMMFR